MAWARWVLMRVLLGSALAVVLVAGLRWAPPAAAEARGYADLALVLAVDVSLSMDIDEQRLQRDGYVAAFRDPAVLKAIKSGPNGRILVAYMEWAGGGVQSVVIPWRVIGGASEAKAFADELAAKPISRAMMTSISGAVTESAGLFRDMPLDALRRVIDVSGDGPNNSGGHVEVARDRAVAAGIVINGLAIRLGRSTAYTLFDLPDLDRYYKDCVIGGPGSFVLSIRAREEFVTAIRQKLLLEIAGLGPNEGVRLRRVQFQPPAANKYDCLVGEKLWEQYRGGTDP